MQWPNGWGVLPGPMWPRAAHPIHSTWTCCVESQAFFGGATYVGGHDITHACSLAHIYCHPLAYMTPAGSLVLFVSIHVPMLASRNSTCHATFQFYRLYVQYDDYAQFVHYLLIVACRLPRSVVFSLYVACWPDCPSIAEYAASSPSQPSFAGAQASQPLLDSEPKPGSLCLA